MPKVVYDKLNYHELAPIAMCLQLADQTIRYPAGIAENVPVKIRNFFIPIDFVVVTPLVLILCVVANMCLNIVISGNCACIIISSHAFNFNYVCAILLITSTSQNLVQSLSEPPFALSLKSALIFF